MGSDGTGSSFDMIGSILEASVEDRDMLRGLRDRRGASGRSDSARRGGKGLIAPVASFDAESVESDVPVDADVASIAAAVFENANSDTGAGTDTDPDADVDSDAENDVGIDGAFWTIIGR